MSISRRQFCGGVLAGAALTLGGCAAPFGSRSSYITQIVRPQNNNTVFHWMDVILQQVRDQRVPPPRAAYNLAMPTVAGFLAANGVERRYHQAFGIGDAPAGCNAEIAYAAAFSTAAAEVFKTPFLAETSSFLRRFPDGESKTRSIEWGKRVGKHIVRLRVDDGSEPSEVNYYLDRYERREDALRWAPTGPFYSARPGPAFGTFARPLFPGHGKIKPWTMTSSSQFRGDPFYDEHSREFAEDFDSVYRLGGEHSRIRSADQAEIALFWEDGPWGITPPGHFSYIGMQVMQDRGFSFIEFARAFALIGATQCDASINAWDNKYAYDVIRPETAIRRRAHKFQNSDPRIRLDKKWRSYIPTPEFPAYTSGHSTFGAAGMKMVELLIGTDSVSLSGISPDQVLWPKLRGVTRSWTSLSQMAEENGMSRIYGGVHWMKDHTVAMKAGYEIAHQAYHNMFLPRGA